MTVSPKALARFREQAPRWHPIVKGRRPESLQEIIRRATQHEYQGKTQPRPHQLEALAYALAQRRALLFLAMRLGKSKIALDWAAHLKRVGLWRGLGLIVAHAPIALQSVWAVEAAKHSDLKVALVQKGYDEFLQACESDCDLVVTPWSGLQQMFSTKRVVQRGKRKGQNKLYVDHDRVRATGELFTLAIMDEIHLCKNPQSLRFKIAVELVARAQYRLGLTGTPVGRDPFALWAQCYLVDRGDALSRSYHFFELAYGKKEFNFAIKRELVKFDQARLDDMLKRAAGTVISYRKEEVHVDKVMRNVTQLHMGPSQSKRYFYELSEYINKWKAGEEPRDNIFMKLRQIASGFEPYVDSLGGRFMLPLKHNVKLEWLRALLEEQETETCMVIFHEFIATGDMISAMLKEIGIKHARIEGATKDKSAELSKFTSGKVKLLVANTATGGVGIDLRNADYLLFYESPVSPTVRSQAEARPLAIERGDRPLVIEDLVCAPVEQRILDFIQEGKNLMRAVMSDPEEMQRIFS